ncbi:MAG: hypothetical protein WAQ99_08680 [Pyrinomonadaceae bacterium]
MNNYTLPLLSVIVGTLFGLLSTLFISSIKQRQGITLRLLDQYFQVRQEIVDVVTDLANLRVRQPLEDSRRQAYRDSVSKLFYKHYDFLPEAVLEALTLLDVSLSSSEGTLYTLKGRMIVPMKESEINAFIDKCSVYDNTRLFAPLALSSKNPSVRTNQAISLHARNVLYTLNKFTSIKDLLALTKKLKKGSAI